MGFLMGTIPKVAQFLIPLKYGFLELTPTRQVFTATPKHFY